MNLNPARIFHTVGGALIIFHIVEGALINAVALAQRKDPLALGELFQQFVPHEGKPMETKARD